LEDSPTAKEVRTLMDDLGLPAYSTHIVLKRFTRRNDGQGVELNQFSAARILIHATVEKWEG